MQFDELLESEDLGPHDRALTDEELEDLLAPEETATQVTFSSQDFDGAGLVRRVQSESMLIPRFVVGMNEWKRPGSSEVSSGEGRRWTGSSSHFFSAIQCLGYF